MGIAEPVFLAVIGVVALVLIATAGFAYRA
jgi:hypothetical protein